MFINGSWCGSDRNKEVRNPFNHQAIGKLPQATETDIDNALKAAFAARPIMADLPIHRRAEILQNTAHLIKGNAERLTEAIIAEAGKPRKWAAGEVARAIENLKFAAAACLQIHGETVPMDASIGSEKRMGFWLRVPVGVVVAIPPFNFPLNLVVHKVAPAIAAGNPVVLKPASNTPGASQILVELLLQAGLPKEGIQLLFGSGSRVGEAIVKDPRVSKITFTGSPPVGKRIKQISGLKRLTLELGSNSGTIIDEDADLNLAIPRCVMGSFAFSGQVCISVQRIYVHQKIFQEFTENFCRSSQALTIGDPADAQTDIGPMISVDEALRLKNWIDEAVGQGARILTGGSHRGALFEPTLLTDVKAEMQVMCREVFGPLVSIIPFNTFSAALEMINDSIFGLQAGVFTQNIAHAFEAVKKIDAGGVIINDVPTYRVDQMPYGGTKGSGIGREGAKFAIEEMTNLKMVAFNL